jgi:hypothetical protein
MKALNSVLIEGMLIRNKTNQMDLFQVIEKYIIRNEEATMPLAFFEGKLKDMVDSVVDKKGNITVRIVGSLMNCSGVTYIKADHVEFKGGGVAY